MDSSRPGHDIASKERTTDVLTKEKVSFKDLLLSPSVLSGLQKARFEQPSPIQLKAIPYGRCGLDLIVQAKSGTGKTCVFTVVALESLSVEAPTLQVIILAPTREIAIQIEEVIKAVGQDIKGLKSASFIGGRPLSEDKVNAKGCHIAVGSPGRIFQLLELDVLKCQTVRIFILDEADKLLEENFQSQINSIYSILPTNKQMIAASATYPDELAQFVTLYMRDPIFVRLNPKDMALLGVQQYCYLIEDPPEKFQSAFECKIKAVLTLLESCSFQQALIFSNYHSHAKDLSDACNSIGLPATYISGNLEQERRLEAMKMLKEFKCRVLISTDLTSRGIDASNIDLVVNLDVPHDWETYMHRTGRAGRFGSLGAIISVVHSGKEKEDLFRIVKACSVSLYHVTCKNGKLNFGANKIEFQDINHERPAHSLHKTPAKTTGHSVVDEPTAKTVVESSVAAEQTSLEKGGALTGIPKGGMVSELPGIPTLPALMFRGCKADSAPFSYSFPDLMENFLYYKEHGVFKELKRVETKNTPDMNISTKQSSTRTNIKSAYPNSTSSRFQNEDSKQYTKQHMPTCNDFEERSIHASSASERSGGLTCQFHDEIITETAHQKLPAVSGTGYSESYPEGECQSQPRMKVMRRKECSKLSSADPTERPPSNLPLDDRGSRGMNDKRKKHKSKKQGHALHENLSSRKNKDKRKKHDLRQREDYACASVKLLLPRYSAESKKFSQGKFFDFTYMTRQYEIAWYNYYCYQYWKWWRNSLGLSLDGHHC